MTSKTNLKPHPVPPPAQDPGGRTENGKTRNAQKQNPARTDKPGHQQRATGFPEIQALIDDLSTAVVRYAQGCSGAATGPTVEADHRAALHWILTALEDVSATCRGITLHPTAPHR